MYQFTREFIINDNEGKLSGKKIAVSGNTMFVDNMVNIRKKDVNAVYYHPWEEAANEKVTIDDSVFAGVAKGEVVRLVITLGQMGKTTAPYNDTYPEHSRHFFYEMVNEEAAPDAGDVVDGLVASYEHEANLARDIKFLTISNDGSDNLVIDAPDCYTIVREVRIVKLPQATATAKQGALLTGYEDWDAMLIWKRKEGNTAKVTFNAGKEGNGNTVQILKNMRLLTDAHINPYGLQMDERPMPKGKYDQYTVEIATERRHIGHDVMGSVGTSLSTFVFYVLVDGAHDYSAYTPTAGDSASADFYLALSALGCTPEKVLKLDGLAGTPADVEQAAPAPVHGRAKDVKANAAGVAANAAAIEAL